MAKDALGIYLYTLEQEKIKVPSPSDPQKIKYNKKQDFVALVDLDMLEYIRKHDNKAVKKTLTIPHWLNYLAEEKGVNFSNVLQTALKEKLHIQTVHK